MNESPIKNPRYVNAEGTLINVEKHNEIRGWIDMTLSAEDYPELWNEAIAQIPLPFDKPTKEEQAAINAADIRYKRDMILTNEVDPIVSNPLRWEDMSKEDQFAYRVYRKSLLDVTEQPTFPDNVEWPILVLSTRS